MHFCNIKKHLFITLLLSFLVSQLFSFPVFGQTAIPVDLVRNLVESEKLLALKNNFTESKNHSFSPDISNVEELYFFYGQECPHCAKAKPFLENLEKKYSQLKVRSFEVYGDEKNRELFSLLAQAYGRKIEGVPMIFIGDKVFVGYNDTISMQIEQAVKDCLNLKCASPIEKLRIIETLKHENIKTQEYESAQSVTNQRNLPTELISAIVLFLILGLIIFSGIKLIKKNKSK